MLNDVARGIYALALVANMAWTAAVMKFVYILPLDKKTKEGWCLLLTQLGWRIAFFFAPWIRCITNDTYWDEWKDVLKNMSSVDAEDIKAGKPRRPLFVLANHMSFLDTIFTVTVMPGMALWRLRTYMDHHLFKIPILSTISRCVGHFPVYFKTTTEGAFKVDNEKMEEVEKRVDGHLQGGGWLCFFPEGQMNGSPDKLLPFRYGGMKRALEYDARILSMVTRGNEKVWPRKMKVGGFPGEIRASIRFVAPEGAKAFVEAARKEGLKEDEAELPDHALLAKRAQELMQTQYDAMPITNGAKSIAAGEKQD